MGIAVASGKGGTGKTTVASSLAKVAAEMHDTVLVDCDVEAPNAQVFFPGKFQERQTVTIQIPQVDVDQCSSCGECARVCQYHAIVMLKEYPCVFPELCHGCGSCSLICPEQAIGEIPQPIGQLEQGMRGSNLLLQQGTLNVGQPLAVPVISRLKTWSDPGLEEIKVIDAPPGASCPVVESLRGVDFVILVTEPTPFGLHDLDKVHQITRQMGIPSGVIINREGIGDHQVEQYCQESHLPILMHIPLERKFGEGLAMGKTLLEIEPNYYPVFHQMLLDILQEGMEINYQ